MRIPLISYEFPPDTASGDLGTYTRRAHWGRLLNAEAKKVEMGTPIIEICHLSKKDHHGEVSARMLREEISRTRDGLENGKGAAWKT